MASEKSPQQGKNDQRPAQQQQPQQQAKTTDPTASISPRLVRNNERPKNGK